MGSDENNSLDAMSSEFIAEIKDDLASLEPDLLSMEESGGIVDDELINHAFRSIHSIKGGASFINFKILADLSHALENVLMRVREKSLDIDSNIVDALLSGFDKMKLMVESIGTTIAIEYDKEKQMLESIVKKKNGLELPIKEYAGQAKKKSEKKESKASLNIVEDKIEEIKKPAVEDKIKTKHKKLPEKIVLEPIGANVRFQGKAFEVDTKHLDIALKSQKFIYGVYLKFTRDVDNRNRDLKTIEEVIESIGDILFPDRIKQSEWENKDDLYYVVATILDLPLLAHVLEINKMQVVLLNRQFVDLESIINEQFSNNFVVKKKSHVSGSKKLETADQEYFDEKQGDIPPKSSQGTDTLRINMDLITRLMNRAGELVLSRNQLRPVVEAYAHENSSIGPMMQNLDLVTTDIQEAVMQMRMQPVNHLLFKYKRVVRDIARKMAKKVAYTFEGGEVEVDRSILESLSSPFTHLIRNCIDHGVEPPLERLIQSKPETGSIHIKVFSQGGQVHILIKDDGAGIDPDVVAKKAVEKKLIAKQDLENLRDKEKISLIFLPGFSMSEEITDISGRGVGMDVVKTNLKKLRGHIEIESEPGLGTSFHITIPLTLSIVSSLIVGVGGWKFAIPQIRVKEVIYLEPGQIHTQVEQIGGAEVLRLREALIPIIRLRNVLDIKTWVTKKGLDKPIEERRQRIADRRYKDDRQNEPGLKRSNKKDRRKNKWDSTYIVVLKLGQHRFGICVDELFDIEEIVVEPLSEYIKDCRCFSGATILGDGTVVMILDIPGIVSYMSLRFETIKNEEITRKKGQKEDKKGELQSLIVFSHAASEYFAIDLTSLSRLEPIEVSHIHHTGGLKYMEYDQKAVSLFSLDEFLSATPFKKTDEIMYSIMLKGTDKKMGIIATSIIDTIELHQDLDQASLNHEIVAGKLFIDNMMVQVLDQNKIIRLMEMKVADVQTTDKE
ncbi:MAG: chemotaxis protein CheA [Desulfobacteraceae bacterium]|nr:chemotaxis protein CheA [Desulfobacteraceae bacterium]